MIQHPKYQKTRRTQVETNSTRKPHLKWRQHKRTCLREQEVTN